MFSSFCLSLGGLGKDKSVACVSDILVENSNIQNTLYGARIKTWQVHKRSLICLVIIQYATEWHS